MDDRIDLLQRVPLFAGMDRADLEQVARIMDDVDVPAGTILAHEGRHEGYFYLITEGTVQIDQAGRTVNTMGPGDFLGEIALLDGGARTATATALTRAHLLSMRFQEFDALLERSPNVRAAVDDAAGRHLAHDEATPV
jgi:CPA1 family monovalent cation:H+ antiporter